MELLVGFPLQIESTLADASHILQLIPSVSAVHNTNSLHVLTAFANYIKREIIFWPEVYKMQFHQALWITPVHDYIRKSSSRTTATLARKTFNTSQSYFWKNEVRIVRKVSVALGCNLILVVRFLGFKGMAGWGLHRRNCFQLTCLCTEDDRATVKFLWQIEVYTFVAGVLQFWSQALGPTHWKNQFLSCTGIFTTEETLQWKDTCASSYFCTLISSWVLVTSSLSLTLLNTVE